MEKLPLEYENSLPPTYSVFRTVHFKRRHFDASYHLHSCCEMTAVDKGHGKFVIDDIIYDIADHHISLVAPNIPHTYISDETCQKTDWYLMQFPTKMFSDILDFKCVWNLFENGEVAYIYDESVFAQVKKYFLKMESTKYLERFSAFLSLIDVFLNSKKRVIYSTNKSSEKAHDARLEKIENYLAENYREKIDLHRLAKLVGMDTLKLGRFFARCKKIPIKQYIKRLRILNICKEIAYSDKSISEIALNNGYDNISNFNRQFRAQVGCTPAQYKKAKNTFK